MVCCTSEDGVGMVVGDVVCVIAEVTAELVMDIVVLCSDAEGMVGAVMISDADD